MENVSWYDAIDFLNKLSDKDGLERCYKGENQILRLKDWIVKDIVYRQKQSGNMQHEEDRTLCTQGATMFQKLLGIMEIV